MSTNIENYVFFLGSKILNEGTIEEYHQFDKLLIVITDGVQGSWTSALDHTFQILWENGLINSNVLISGNLQSWSLFTSMPYHIDCSILSYRKLMTLTRSNLTEMSLSTKQLYPEKLKNFNQCPLNIAASLSEPFVFLRRNSGPNSDPEGIEIEIMTQITKLLNFSVVFENTTDGTNHGFMYSNGIVTGNMELVK